jgi:hypothetical protein
MQSMQSIRRIVALLAVTLISVAHFIRPENIPWD